MGVRGILIEPPKNAQRRANLVLEPAAHLEWGGFQLLQRKRKARHSPLPMNAVRRQPVDTSENKDAR
jgi:hypothetical protein